MTNPEDPVVLDLRSSFSREEAVAKMLGWMRGITRPMYIQLGKEGFTEEHLAHVSSLECSLEEQLDELHEKARSALVAAAENDESYEVLGELEAAVVRSQKQIFKAASYLRDLDDELAKGAESALRIDRPLTEKTGEVHITLKSLDQWCSKNYGFSVVPPEQEHEADAAPIEDDLGLGKNAADNLYALLGFLVEMLAERVPGYKKSSGDVNVSTVALDILERCKNANGGESLHGFGKRTMESNLASALIAKRNKLSGR